MTIFSKLKAGQRVTVKMSEKADPVEIAWGPRHSPDAMLTVGAERTPMSEVALHAWLAAREGAGMVEVQPKTLFRGENLVASREKHATEKHATEKHATEKKFHSGAHHAHSKKTKKDD